jgi:uncharacterized protein YndB with AHSA1/START domain
VAPIVVRAQRTVNAPASVVYSYVADMEHHQRFLPGEFSDFTVQSGGVGAGTVITFTVTAAGRRRDFRMRIDEPDPGRVLTETDQNSSLVTTYTVTPAAPRSSLVEIVSTWQGASGIGGIFERTFAPPATRRLYAKALDRLDTYVREHPPA